MKNLFSHQKLKFCPVILLFISILFLFLPRFSLSQIDSNGDNHSAGFNRSDTVSSSLDQLEGGKEQTIVAASDEAGIKGTFTQTVELPLLLEVQGRASHIAPIAKNEISEQIEQKQGQVSEDNQTTEKRDAEIASLFEKTQGSTDKIVDKAQSSADKIDQPGEIPQDDTTKENISNKLPDIKISLSFADVPLSDVLNTLTKIADLNLVGGEGLSQKVTIYLKDVTLQEALDSVLRSAGYTYIPEGKILRIVPIKEGTLITKVFELKFASADQIVNALSGIMSGRGMVKSFAKFSEAKEKSTLIIKDTPEAIKDIITVISKLDIKPRQVMIATQLVEVTLSNTNNLGIDWVMKASMYGAKGPTTFPLGREFQRIVERPYDPANTLLVAPSTSYILGQFNFADFTANLQLIDSKTKVEIVSDSRIAVREAEEAEIVVGDRVPIPVYERVGESATLAVTGYIEEHVGVILKVTPVINEDNSVTLRVRPEISEITGWTGPNDERPIVSTRQLTTALTIADGNTIVLGGLKKKVNTKLNSKTPFFGNLPFIGGAFNYKSDTGENKELLIIITPNIIKEKENADG